MEQIKLPDPGHAGPAIQLPVQLSLTWGDMTTESAEAAPQVPQRSPQEELTPWAGAADARREQMIETETRRVKMVCISLFGLFLLGLRFLDS